MTDKIPNVLTSKNYVTRKYEGVQSVQDMTQINLATAKAIDKFSEHKKPVRILLDLRGKFASTPEIYEEAIKILGLYEIQKIALLQPKDQKLETLTQNTRSTFEQTTEYRQFNDESAAQEWLDTD